MFDSIIKKLNYELHVRPCGKFHINSMNICNDKSIN